MNAINPDSGNAPGLAKYLADMQTQAHILAGLIRAADEACHKEAVSACIIAARPYAEALSLGLDSVKLPRGTLE